MKLKEIIQIENCADLKIGKRSDNRSKYYYCRFYVSPKHKKDGYYFESLKTKSEYEAYNKAKEIWKNFQGNVFHNQESAPVEKRISRFCEMYLDDLRDRVNNDEIKDYGIQRTEKGRIYETILPFFDEGQKDISKITYRDINKLFKEYIPQTRGKLTGKTLLHYKSLLTQIFKFAVRENVITNIPEFPKIKKNNSKNYIPYTDEQLSLIKDEFRKRRHLKHKYFNDDIDKEMVDIINWLRFVPVRAGQEFLELKHKHIQEKEFVSNGEKYIGLIINPPVRKVTKNISPIMCRPLAREIYVNSICKRYPIKTGDEYLFINNKELRSLTGNKLQRRIAVRFAKMSKRLGFFYTDAGNRPLYSLRSTQFIDDVRNGSDIQELARNGNTSVQMLNENYLKKYSSYKQEEILSNLYKHDKRK